MRKRGALQCFVVEALAVREVQLERWLALTSRADD